MARLRIRVRRSHGRFYRKCRYARPRVRWSAGSAAWGVSVSMPFRPTQSATFIARRRPRLRRGWAVFFPWQAQCGAAVDRDPAPNAPGRQGRRELLRVSDRAAAVMTDATLLPLCHCVFSCVLSMSLECAVADALAGRPTPPAPCTQRPCPDGRSPTRPRR